MKEERIRKQELEEKQMELERVSIKQRSVDVKNVGVKLTIKSHQSTQIRKNKEIQRTTAAVVTIQKGKNMKRRKNRHQ